MNRAFLFFFIGAVLVGFFTIDVSALGGQTVIGWLCPDSWSICNDLGSFVRQIGR